MGKSISLRGWAWVFIVKLCKPRLLGRSKKERLVHHGRFWGVLPYTNFPVHKLRRWTEQSKENATLIIKQRFFLEALKVWQAVWLLWSWSLHSMRIHPQNSLSYSTMPHVHRPEGRHSSRWRSLQFLVESRTPSTTKVWIHDESPLAHPPSEEVD